ncbi:RNA-guided endonuclease InsQ/TnpB family protein [Nonomuraea sediminis]|uniref:RNA-guided endonuclease InsQ/TnpB family protein n=1 Tax=Nonomuraea sediminis TaxID=2835864 RepID=UPI001BDD9B4B|nr:RNA-guided endonuclease TnpB family protein [Nonomuraea sediminis]
MARYRLQPTLAQESKLLEHCAHARYVWNLAVEQHRHWRPGRASAPGFAEQCRQLSDARQETPWLRAGSVVVQQQALRDFAQALARFFIGSQGRPTWRKVGRNEGFRIVAMRSTDVRRVSRRVGELRIPKVGWVRFRWSRPVPEGVKSFRVTLDRAGRWHVGFAAVPQAIRAPDTGEVVGLDRGIVVSAALSTGELLTTPRPRPWEVKRRARLQRRLGRAKQGSRRRADVRQARARLMARGADRRKDWVEKTSTDLARRFDLIVVEDLDVRAMTRAVKGTPEAPGRNVRQKAGLNRGIAASGWGALVARLDAKASGRVVRVAPRYTSQTCNSCKHVARENRKSQALFLCEVCGHRDNADVNAARNIRDTAAGRAVAAREGPRAAGPVHREPQPDLLVV